MSDYVLAGDVGRTKTVLALYALGAAGELVLEREASFPSASFTALEQVLTAFIGESSFPIAASVRTTSLSTGPAMPNARPGASTWRAGSS